MQITTGRKKSAAIVVNHAAPGLGKTTLASKAKGSLFLDFEGGTNQLDVHKFDKVIAEMSDFKEAHRMALESDFKTIVYDSITKLDDLFIREILRSNNQPTLSFGYGAGHAALEAYWAFFMKQLVQARDEQGKNFILIGHSEVIKVNDPTLDEPYDRFDLNVEKRSRPHIVNNADAVLFGQLETIVLKNDKTNTNRAKTTGNRVLRTTEKPAYLAKNRFSLPDTVPMTEEIWAEVLL
jgi:hypothetical protein